ncbi:protein saal1 [Rhipicephalus sanguineus]|nr:protein saal1 [Rhipicephalus sanguineus]
MMDDTERNPSPPPEILEADESSSGDRIGDSVFSRHWLFQCLLKAIRAAENENACGEGEQVLTEEEVVELDREVEEELCTVWDMAANSDVAHFLHEFKASEIFLQIISTSKSPRLVEILIGILGNMAVFPDLSLALSKEEGILQMAMQLLGGTDTPTLVQVLRLCHTCLSNKESLPFWLQAIRSSDSCLSGITFILENSINEELLKVTLQVLDCVLDEDSEMCAVCANGNFIEALFTAASYLSSREKYDSLDAFWHLLHVMDYEADAKELLLPCCEKLESLLVDWLQGQEASPLPPRHCWRTLGSAVTLVSGVRQGTGSKAEDDELYERLKEMHLALQARLHDVQSNSDSKLQRPESIDDTFHMLQGALEQALGISARQCTG